MFHFDYDDAAGILHIRVEGAWSLPEIERYGREAGPQFARARMRAGMLRLLIDISRANLLTQDLIQPLAHAGMQHSRHDDRVALVVASSLMKIQMRRMMGNAPADMFISDEAARTWLTARAGAAQSAA